MNVTEAFELVYRAASTHAADGMGKKKPGQKESTGDRELRKALFIFWKRVSKMRRRLDANRWKRAQMPARKDCPKCLK